MKKEEKSVFGVLNAINCNGHTEKKNGLTYLAWAWAWQMVKENYPTATYTIYENADGMNYHTDGRTCWVKTGVTIEGLEHIEYLPVMDYRNASIPKDKVTSMDVNKAIQRSLTKACARHGLGLYIYAGEDLPSGEAEKMSADDEADFELACQRMKEAKNRDELVAIWNDCPKFHTRQEFVDRLYARQAELSNN
jgi:hypothetical protein